jgi:hypothetical protein
MGSSGSWSWESELQGHLRPGPEASGESPRLSTSTAGYEFEGRAQQLHGLRGNVWTAFLIP